MVISDGELSRGGFIAAAKAQVEQKPWGRLEWMVAGDMGNSDVLTVGKCLIDSGNHNPAHFHPNCDEVLYVIRGTIWHRIGERYLAMGPGDAISIPRGAVHNSENTGEEQAELLIVFSTATREVVGE